ncbi:protein NRT1/ PTR FAMILY 5.10-like [Wolffia australiana]
MEGHVDYRGRPILSRSAAGGWTSAAFIIGAEVLERFAYYGISINLISYLTGPLRQSTAAAAANVNAWSGAAMMLPLLGGLIGDSSIGRFRTAVISSVIYVLGLAALAVSAAEGGLSRVRTAVFFLALYAVAVAQGGHKPCAQAFGADQFDSDDPDERFSRSSFFNWMYFGVCGGTAVTVLLMSYLQDNVGWGVGFGLPCASMAVASALFLSGSPTYRFSRKSPNSASSEQNKEPLLLEKSRSGGWEDSARGILRLLPIWATCLVYAVVFAQSSTFFTKQGSTMDRRIGPNFLVPPAALQSFISVSILASLPLYDRFFVPIARSITGRPAGVTMLQRIGVGMVLSIAAMAVAAMVETKRLRIGQELGSAVTMSLWWLVPQYVLYGVSDVFTMVGLQEFFYDQAPDGLRSFGMALYLSIFGIGSFVSGFLVIVIQKISALFGDDWFSDDLNRAHLDYFYLLLAALSCVEFLLYLYFARRFRYKQGLGHSV